MLDLFKIQNETPESPKTRLSLDEVTKSLKQEFDWSFLPGAARDIINRNSYGTVAIADFLFKYKYESHESIIEVMSYATALPFTYLETLDGLVHEIHSNFITVKVKGGTASDVYLDASDIISEAQLNVILPGKIADVYYLLPTNYKKLVTSAKDYSDDWDYYALFGRYMWYCIEHKASDIHFEAIHRNKETCYRVMCRIGPDREECRLFDFDVYMNRNLIRDTVKERSSNQTSILDLDKGNGVVVNIPDIFSDGRLEVRFTADKVIGGYYCVCRLQELKTVSLTLEELGFDSRIIKLIRESTERPSGLTVITGKIRTGKNTTMASISNDIISRDTNPSLMGLEDPVEILGEYPQSDYKGEISLLKSGIRLAKKLDLDYVTLNEIPNPEVAFGIRDLVNSSIHTMTTWHMNRVWHLPHKLFEYYGDSYRDLVSQMNLVCNQRLYKKQCPHCQKTVHRDMYVEEPRIHAFFMKYDLISSKVSQGCDKCNNTGYIPGGIVVLPELLIFNQELISNLFKAQYPYEMERVLFAEMLNSEFSLERQMCLALTDGRLSPREVISIV